MPLTAEQRLARRFKFTASMAPAIVQGDTFKVRALWEEAIGQREPEDLSNNWAVQFGSHNETFGLDWNEKKTGHKLTERGRVVDHPLIPLVACTLDAYRQFDDAVIDHKVCNGHRKLDEIISYYTPQILIQMRCRLASRGVLLVLHGGAEPVEYDVYFDDAYEELVWERVRWFQQHVETFTDPHPVPPLVPPEQWRKIDLDGTADTWPNWGPALVESLVAWEMTKDQADRNHEAVAEIKTLLPADVARVRHGGHQIIRNRRGAVTIKRGNE